jgi:hypothetical protein
MPQKRGDARFNFLIERWRTLEYELGYYPRPSAHVRQRRREELRVEGGEMESLTGLNIREEVSR